MGKKFISHLYPTHEWKTNSLGIFHASIKAVGITTNEKKWPVI